MQHLKSCTKEKKYVRLERKMTSMNEKTIDRIFSFFLKLWSSDGNRRLTCLIGFHIWHRIKKKSILLQYTSIPIQTIILRLSFQSDFYSVRSALILSLLFSFKYHCSNWICMWIEIWSDRILLHRAKVNEDAPRFFLSVRKKTHTHTQKNVQCSPRRNRSAIS